MRSLKHFRSSYPVRDHDVEISNIEFLVDPESPIPIPLRQVSRLAEIDFVYINEQIRKCDEKISLADFEGAITNARNLLESICKYILDDLGETYDEKSDLPDIFHQASQRCNMHPSQHSEKSFKQILSGCFSIVQGIAAIRNEISDAHGKFKTRYYRPDERHAMFAVSAAKTVADFMYASYMDRTKKTTQPPAPGGRANPAAEP